MNEEFSRLESLPKCPISKTIFFRKESACMSSTSFHFKNCFTVIDINTIFKKLKSELILTTASLIEGILYIKISGFIKDNF